MEDKKAKPLIAKDSALMAISMLALVALWLPIVLIGHGATIAGERYWWLCDDAMISMRYARNLANGFGLVWNPGERVEGYTNFLWIIYMAFVHLFPVPASKTSLIVLLTNIVLIITTIPVIIRLVRMLGGDTLVTAATLVVYILNKSVMWWTVAGLETTFITFLFLLTTYRVIRESQLAQISRLTFVLIAIMPLVRADAVILSVLLYALSLLLNSNRKLVVIYSLSSLILPIMHEIFRIFYYGDVLPNTAYLKTSNWPGRYDAGVGYVLDFAKQYSIVIGCAAIGLLLSRKRPHLYLFGVFLAYSVYVAYVGGDAFKNFRFFVPVIPLLLVLAFLGIQSLNPKPSKFVTLDKSLVGGIGIAIAALSLTADVIGLGGKTGFGAEQLYGVILGTILAISSLALPLLMNKQIVSQERLIDVAQRIIKLTMIILCLVTTPLIIPGYTEFLAANDFKKVNIKNITIGLLLKQNTLPTSKVADSWAGSVFYFSERYAIDLLGRSNRHVARLTVTSKGTKPGHNKFDFDYSLGTLKPDFIIAEFKLPVQEDEMLKETTGDWAFSGQLYFHPVFQKHCLPNPVAAETWRTIFVCDWSPQIDNRNNWQALPFSR